MQIIKNDLIVCYNFYYKIKCGTTEEKNYGLLKCGMSVNNF